MSSNLCDTYRVAVPAVQVFTAVNQVIRAQPQQTDVLYLAEALLKLGFDVVVRRVRGDATSGEQVFR